MEQTQQQKREKTTNAIHYYINDDSCPTQRQSSFLFGITELRFATAWKKFKKENNLITKGGYVTFRDMPKYPCFNEVEN